MADYTHMPSVNIYLPGPLAKEAKERGLQISALAQRAIREELDRMSTTTEHPRLKEYLRQLGTLTAAGPDRSDYEFRGAWIIGPLEDCRSGEPGQDAGAVWSVAVTAKGRFAVHLAHCNNRWEPHLDDYDTLDEVLENLPDDVAAELSGRLTGVRRLDI